jgi:hypothetical protein
MNTPENLGVQVADKTNDQLSAMLKQPDDWRPEALDAARAELQRRGVAASTIAFANSSTPHPDDTPKSSSSLEWYYVVGDERRGPVSEPTLIAIVKSGALNKSTKIWKEGFPKWILLENTPFPEFLPRQGPPPLDQVETANHEEENDRPQPSISETKGLKEPLYNDATDATAPPSSAGIAASR